jgi:hypothetical protein
MCQICEWIDIEIARCIVNRREWDRPVLELAFKKSFGSRFEVAEMLFNRMALCIYALVSLINVVS